MRKDKDNRLKTEEEEIPILFGLLRYLFLNNFITLIHTFIHICISVCWSFDPALGDVVSNFGSGYS